MARTRLSGRTAATILAVVALGVVSGCGHGSSSSAVTLPSASSSRPAGSTAPATAHHSRVGTCHLVTAAVLHGSVDHSPAISCSRRHNVETAGTHPVFSTINRATLQGYLDDCFTDVNSYLHLQDREDIRLNVVPVAERSGGRTVVDCDVTVFSGLGSHFNDPPAVTTTSLRREAADGDTASWHWCTNQSPLGLDIVFSSCTKPHLQEATFHPMTLPVHGSYPAPRALSRRGSAACRKAVADRPDAARLSLAEHWETQRQWHAQSDRSVIVGNCWFIRTDHSDLPAVH